MTQRSKTGTGARRSKGVERDGAAAAARAASPDASAATEPPSEKLQLLTEEVVSLLNEQAFMAGEVQTEREVCESFSDILVRYFDLCCIAVFLRGADGRLHSCADFSHGHVDDEGARRIGEALASEVERAGAEIYLRAGGEAEGFDAPPGLRELFESAGVGAAVAVPIRASGALAGVLAAASSDAARLDSALAGVRCVGQAVVIALGNARRSSAMSEQHRRIESLVEQLRHRTSELEEANRELQRVGRYRSLFLARMSHELRTPLTSILGFAEILIDQEHLTATQRRFCEKIQSSGFQLQASLNQLVDLSRLEAGHTELFLHEFSLRETLRESCSAVARLAQKQDVKLDCAAAPELGGIVSDEGKLRQVLYNFLAFAIGRSPAGGSVRVNAAPSEGGRLDVEITDEGGPLQDPASLFEPVDIDAPSESGTNMNELGLVIAHRLLGVLGGTVALRDLRPAGLRVILSLPARPTES